MGEQSHGRRHIRHNARLSVMGVGALVANKLRYSIGGYRSPRPYGNDQIEMVIDYSIETARKMCSWASTSDIRGQRILELGPGDNLCVGLLLLAMGAESYDAVDINDLVLREGLLYDRLFERMADDGLPAERARLALADLNRGPLRYHVLDDFDLRALEGRRYDRLWSQAAFEHFTDPILTIGQLDALAAPGAEIGVEIDLMTHTRALRSQDPLNIYRIPCWLYRSLHFAGIPNRYRTRHYKTAFEASGWSQVTVDRIVTVPAAEFAQIQPWLAGPFRGADAEMSDLVVVIRGRRASSASQLAHAA